MRVIVSDRAEADIEAIIDFIAEDNPARAASFARELLSACRDLTERPFRFAALRNFEHRGYTDGGFMAATSSSIALKMTTSLSCVCCPARWMWIANLIRHKFEA